MALPWWQHHKHCLGYYYSFSIYGPLGQHGSDCSRDLVTLICDLWGHNARGWCELSSSIRTRSLKFVCLAIRTIWRTMCVSINGPGDHELWLFDHETGVRVASKVMNLPSKFGHAMPLSSRIIRYVRDGRTDTSNAYCSLPYGRGHNNLDKNDRLSTCSSYEMQLLDQRGL